MIPGIISAFKDENVRLAKEETERHRITAQLELNKTVEVSKIKLEQRQAELTADFDQLKRKCSHDLQVQQLKEETREKELTKDVEISRQNMELEKEKLKNHVDLAKLQVEQYKLDLDHKVSMAKLQQESDRDALLCGFLHKQSDKGITGPAFAYNGTVARQLLQGEKWDHRVMGSLNGFLEQQLQLEGVGPVRPRTADSTLPVCVEEAEEDHASGSGSRSLANN